MKTHPKVVSKAELFSFRAKLQRHQLIVYFFTGVLPRDHSPDYTLQVSSSTITEKTLFISHQKAHHA